MHKLVPALLSLALLTGCGANARLAGAGLAGGSLAAQSKAGVEKGIHAMFRAAFKAADRNGDKRLSLDEVPTALPVPPVPGYGVRIPVEPVELDEARKAMLAQLDLNKDGTVTYREFARPDAQQTAIIFYRAEMAKLFAALDKNGDHVLTPNEAEGQYNFAELDLNKNNKVTSSEFEDSFVRTFGQGPDPVEPAPAPGEDPHPAPPAPEPEQPVEPTPEG